MKTLTTWLNHAVQYVSRLQGMNTLTRGKEFLSRAISEFFQTIRNQISSLLSKTKNTQPPSGNELQKESSLGEKGKAFLAWCLSIVTEFQSKHNQVQSVIVGLGVILSPSYIFSGKFFNLLDVIQGMANGYPVNLLPFIRLVLETLIFFYFLWIVVSFLISRNPSGSQSIKYERIHPAVSLTYIDMHLLAGETHKPGQDAALVQNLFDSTPSVNEFVTERDEGFVAYKENSTLKEVIDLMYPIEEKQSPFNQRGTKTLLEILNEDDPAPEDEVQAFLTTLNQ